MKEGEGGNPLQTRHSRRDTLGRTSEGDVSPSNTSLLSHPLSQLILYSSSTLLLDTVPGYSPTWFILDLVDKKYRVTGKKFLVGSNIFPQVLTICNYTKFDCSTVSTYTWERAASSLPLYLGKRKIQAIRFFSSHASCGKSRILSSPPTQFVSQIYIHPCTT